MRRRLIQSLLAVAVLAVVLLGVPLAVAGAILTSDTAVQTVQREAATLGKNVDQRLARGEVLTEELIDQSLARGLHATVVLRDRREISTGPPPRGGSYDATVNTPRGAIVTVSESRAEVLADQRRIVLLVVTVATVAVSAAVVLGLFQARRLSVPLVDLADRAERLGAGGANQQFVRYGLEEVDRVAEVLEHSQERISRMLALERQFASDASHQLRTPLTALSMRLEEILHSDDPAVVREEAAVALAQVERLAAVVDDLLANARQSRSASAVPVRIDDVVLQQVEEWRPSFQAARRQVTVSGMRGLVAVVTPGGLAQVLATLLENSLEHGAGQTTVRTRTTGVWVVVEVADAGPGVSPELAPRIFERSVSGGAGTGLGLALARDLAEADGGRLELVRQRPPVFAVFLSAPTSARGAPSQRGAAVTAAATSSATERSATAGKTNRR